MTTRNNKIIFENDNYTVEIADATYQVWNKYTDVMEREDSVWPSAVQAAKFFDESIKELEKGETMAQVIPMSIN